MVGIQDTLRTCKRGELAQAENDETLTVEEIEELH
jgi:hypothetical protein